MVTPTPGFFAQDETRQTGGTATQALQAGTALLAEAGIEDAAFDAAQLLQTVTGQNSRLLFSQRLTAAQTTQFHALLLRRAAHEPLQYLCGSWDFLDFTLSVGPGVLIPRADTEVVCETAIAAVRQRENLQLGAPTVADLCSGTGAIAIGIARSTTAQVTAVELSDEAMAYLRRNTAALAAHVACVQADVFAWQTACAPQSLDVLVSNPPYITAQEMKTLAPELAFEPRMALEAAENGLAFYRHIAAAYTPVLKPGGFIVFEIGSTQSEAVCGILQQAGYTAIRVFPDLAGLPRCVAAQKP